MSFDGSSDDRPLGRERRAGVTVTLVVADGFYQPVEGGGSAYTAMVDADEALRRAADLLAAAETAESAARPMYGWRSSAGMICFGGCGC
jgi:hypothetical protein